MTGHSLERALRFMVQALQRGMFHELPSLWATWTQQVAEMSLQDADAHFQSLIESVDSHKDSPIPLSQFNIRIEEARSKAEAFYENMLHDFFVKPDKGQLLDRMSKRFNNKLALYHGRIQHWVNSLIQDAKEQMDKRLASVELPLDPDYLKKRCENLTIAAKENFAQTLSTFQEHGPPSRHPFSARMPAFAQDPPQQLERDLRAIQGRLEHENDRKIMQVFKMAVDAATQAVEQEIFAKSNKLMGKAKMGELTALVKNGCWQAFERELAQRRWMSQLSHYKTHQALVQTEILDRKMQKLVADNDQKLRAHFNAALERCKNHYKAQKANLAMPVAEEDLERDHKALGVKIKEMLSDQGKDLTDTDQYKGALRQLESALQEGHDHVRQKNIEFWKVHSDEATRCARKENQAVLAKCGLLCLFNKVPRVHKMTSQKHLLDCLKQSGSGSRMPPKLQLQVFENWYNKDLGHESASVNSNFYIMSGLVGAVVLFVCVAMNRQTQPNPYTGGYTTGAYGAGYGYTPPPVYQQSSMFPSRRY
jgi:hypothetical protein